MPQGHDDELDAGARSNMDKVQRKRQMREERRELLRGLDRLLPPSDRQSNPVKTSGSRSCGLAGRSLDNILFDVMGHIQKRGLLSKLPRALRSGRAPLQAGQGAGHAKTYLGEVDRAGFLSSHSVFVAEISLPDWSVNALSPGAAKFLDCSPWASRWHVQTQQLEAQSITQPHHHLSSLVHPDDMLLFLTLGTAAQSMQHHAPSGTQVVRIRMARFINAHTEDRRSGEQWSEQRKTKNEYNGQTSFWPGFTKLPAPVRADQSVESNAAHATPVAFETDFQNPLDRFDPLLDFEQCSALPTAAACPPHQPPLALGPAPARASYQAELCGHLSFEFVPIDFQVPFSLSLPSPNPLGAWVEKIGLAAVEAAVRRISQSITP